MIGFVGSIAVFILSFRKKKISGHVNSNQLLLSLMLFSVGMWSLAPFLYFSKAILFFPELSKLHIPFSLLAGPCAYLYFRNELYKVGHSKKDLWHFCLAMGSVVFLFFWQKNTLPIFILLSGKFVSIAYLMFVLIKTLRLSIGERYALLIVLFFIVLNLAALGVGALGFVLHKPSLQMASAYSLPLLIHLLLLVFLVHPDAFRFLRKSQLKKKYRISNLANLDTESILSAIFQFLENEKPYLDESFTRSDLADEIGLTNHQLSELLSEHAKLSFRKLVNQYRVQEAQKIIQAEPSLNILTIAFSVGYNSKASFNRNFKSITGHTPVEFRRKNTIQLIENK